MLDDAVEGDSPIVDVQPEAVSQRLSDSGFALQAAITPGSRSAFPERAGS
jgi:hypothetical protein